MPPASYFKPAGVLLAALEEIRVSVEEAEALRLKDLEELEQEECAGKMNVSRSTFAGELNAARQKVANALVNGKAIRIEGGNFELTNRRFRCADGHEWDVPVEELTGAPELSYPVCHTTETATAASGGCGSCRRSPREHR